MTQAQGNVIGDAVHCTEAGRSITIRAAMEGDGAITISITGDRIGIDSADLPHLFDLFYRTDQSRSQGIGGRRLGLAITWTIVEGHGGAITVASGGLGPGAAVNILLPLKRTGRNQELLCSGPPGYVITPCISPWAKFGRKRWACFTATGRNSIRPLAIWQGPLFLPNCPLFSDAFERYEGTGGRSGHSDASSRSFFYSVSPLAIR